MYGPDPSRRSEIPGGAAETISAGTGAFSADLPATGRNACGTLEKGACGPDASSLFDN